MTKQRTVLALDIATSTGFAHNNGTSGVWNIGSRASESNDLRLAKFWMQFWDFHSRYPFEEVTFETSYVGNVSATMGLGEMRDVMRGEMRGVMKLFCLMNEIPSRGYVPTSVKTFT